MSSQTYWTPPPTTSLRKTARQRLKLPSVRQMSRLHASQFSETYHPIRVASCTRLASTPLSRLATTLSLTCWTPTSTSSSERKYGAYTVYFAFRGGVCAGSCFRGRNPPSATLPPPPRLTLSLIPHPTPLLSPSPLRLRRLLRPREEREAGLGWRPRECPLLPGS